MTRSYFSHLLFLSAALFGYSGHTSKAVAPVQATSAGRPVLVELFTSEGCSSCPPADELLKDVSGTTHDGALVIGLSEHVTYWNNLGWKDPYSDELYTERQESYARNFGLDGPYTPQIVVNGREQLVGSDGNALSRALGKESRASDSSLQIASARRSGDGLEVAFSYTLAAPADLIAVIADDADRSHVTRGENGGRNLQHVAVARDFARLQTLDGSGQKMVRLKLPHDSPTGEQHVVLFAQQSGQRAVLASAQSRIE